MKRMLLAVVTAFISMTAMADGENGLYIIAGESSNSYPVSEIQKITFSNGNVVVEKTDGTKASTAMTSISRMYFGELETAIQTVEGDGSSIWDGKNIKIRGHQNVKVYHSSGSLVYEGQFLDGESVSMDELPRGVYVIEVGGNSFKIAK